MNKKLFFFDVDGTLIDDDKKKAPQSALDAIKALRAAGHLVFLNSGRTLCFLEYQMELFGISCASCGLGTQIIADGNTLSERRIPHKRGLELREIIRELRLDAVLEAQEAIYFSDRPFQNPDIMEALLDYTSVYCETEVNALGDTSYQFDKFCIQTDPVRPELEAVEKLKERTPDFTCIARGRGFYEFVPRECSKGTAISYVLNAYDIPPSDCYVFGDSANDIAMFQSEAGHKVLMGRHDNSLEPYATLVTETVENDGIFRALKQLNLL